MTGRDELAIAMRNTESMVSAPHGECGAKITITMSEETHLYDLLTSAWDRAKSTPCDSTADDRG